MQMLHRFPPAITLGIAIVASSITPAAVSGAEIDYAFIHPEIPAVLLHDVAEGANGQLVAVGANGVTVRAENGAVTGSTVVPAGQGQFDAVAYGNGQYVAVGTADFGAVSYPTGAAAVSTDGVEWDLIDLNAVDRPSSIAFDGTGKWGAAGSQGYVTFSDDGRTWTRASLPTTYTTQNLWSFIAYGGGNWVVASSYYVEGASRLIFWTSPDAATWERHETLVEMGGVPEVAYGDGDWLFITNNQNPFGIRAVKTSDFSTFEEASQGTGYTPVGLAYHNSTWFHCAGEKLFTSTDGLVWTEQTSAFPPLPPYNRPDAVYGVGAGPSGFAAVGSRSFFQTSTDGTSWTLNNEANRVVADLNGIFVDDARIIAGGDTSTIITSTDGGSTWSKATINDAAANSYNFQDITATASGYLVVGSGLSGTSSDGQTWTVARNPSTGVRPANFGQVAYGNGLALAGGDGNVVFTSSGDLSWTAHTLPTAANTAVRDILFWEGAFYVISGDYFGAKVLSSTDGESWTDLTPTAAGNLSYLTTFGGDLAVVNNSAQLYSTGDTTTWAGPLNGFYGRPVAHGNATYFLGSGYLTNAPERVSLRAAPITIDGGVIFNGDLYAVGAGGAVLKASLEVSGATGLQYGIRADDWIGTTWSGWFWDGYFPWVYSLNHGWMYVTYESETELVAYVLSAGAWTYTNADVYAWFYFYGTADWRVLGGN
jgi:hypothetical protein